MQKHGLRVKQVRGGNQTASNAPNVEAMVGTMGQLGVTHYWIGTDNYDLTKPILPQLDAIKLKVEQFVKLNQKHGTTLMYHTRAGANSVGSVVWDLLYVMKDFDPKYVGLPLGYRAHVAPRRQHVGAADADGRPVRRGDGLEGSRVGAEPRIPRRRRTVSRARRARQRQRRRRARRRRADAVAAAAALRIAGGRRTARAGGAPARAPVGAARAAIRRGRTAGGGRGRGGAARRQSRVSAAAGRQHVRARRRLELAARADGHGPGRHLPLRERCMRDIGFDGPMELQAEYPNGGAESGADKLTLPREMVLGNLKRDS